MPDKPPITRFDIFQFREMVVIRQYRDGWTIESINDGYDEKPADYDPEPVLKWAESQGWTVRRWPGGARAWKGKMIPVRHEGAIRKLRSRLEDELMRNHGVHPRGIQVHALDLAFDL